MIRGSALVSGSCLSVMSFRFKGVHITSEMVDLRMVYRWMDGWMDVCVFDQLIYLHLASFYPTSCENLWL